MLAHLIAEVAKTWPSDPIVNTTMEATTTMKSEREIKAPPITCSRRQFQILPLFKKKNKKNK